MKASQLIALAERRCPSAMTSEDGSRDTWGIQSDTRLAIQGELEDEEDYGDNGDPDDGELNFDHRKY